MDVGMLLCLIFFYDDTGIVAAESEGVAECSLDGSFLRLVKSKIEPWIEVGIVFEMIDGWRCRIMHHAHDAGNGLNDARRAKTVTRHGFG